MHLLKILFLEGKWQLIYCKANILHPVQSHCDENLHEDKQIPTPGQWFKTFTRISKEMARPFVLKFHVDVDEIPNNLV